MTVTIRDRYDLFIDGTHRSGSTGDSVPTIDPATGKAFSEVAWGTEADVDDAVDAARAAFDGWRSTPPAVRGRIARRIADLVRDHAAALARIETHDQGKPLGQARADVERSARYFEYYAGAADKLEGRSIPLDRTTVDFTVREPYGVSGQIVPWNFPIGLTARGVAPALVAGNTVVVKPAPTTPLSALHLAELCREAGVPDGVVNVVTGGTEPGAALTAHGDVDTITFTGSVPTGQAVMEAAAATTTPVTLELGGKNPAIVLPDAKIGSAVEWIATGIFSNAGQVCSAADRAIVHESIHDEFVESIVEVASGYEIGPGIDDPDIGPLNHADHFDSVLEYLELGEREGATIECGGRPIDREGYFVPPTVFSDVDPEMRIATEEIFGPVLVVIPFSTVEEALRIANGTEYGLSAGVFSSDITRALRLARDLEAGSVYVNDWFGGGVETPFGGYKRSGIGREKGIEGLESYLQTKNIAVNLGGS